MLIEAIFHHVDDFLPVIPTLQHCTTVHDLLEPGYHAPNTMSEDNCHLFGARLYLSLDECESACKQHKINLDMIYQELSLKQNLFPLSYKKTVTECVNERNLPKLFDIIKRQIHDESEMIAGHRPIANNVYRLLSDYIHEITNDSFFSYAHKNIPVQYKTKEYCMDELVAMDYIELFIKQRQFNEHEAVTYFFDMYAHLKKWLSYVKWFNRYTAPTRGPKRITSYDIFAVWCLCDSLSFGLSCGLDNRYDVLTEHDEAKLQLLDCIDSAHEKSQ